MLLSFIGIVNVVIMTFYAVPCSLYDFSQKRIAQYSNYIRNNNIISYNVISKFVIH